MSAMSTYRRLQYLSNFNIRRKPQVIWHRITLSGPVTLSFPSASQIFNAQMDLVTSRKRRRAERRAEEQAKARSDEIDLHLKEEAKSSKEQCDVLLISSYPHFI